MRSFFTDYQEFKKADIRELKRDFSIREIQQSLLLLGLREKRGLERALETKGFGVIGELQKRSPFTGKTRENFQPAIAAMQYSDAGVCALSVLTDAEFFQGDKSYIQQVKPLVELPIIRNELIIDEFQIYESRAIGADAVVFVTPCLDPVQLKEYLQLAFELGLECLVEIQSEKELENALKAESRILGINNRDYLTAKIDLEISFRLIPEIPEEIRVVSEYGIDHPDLFSRLHHAGFDGILVGDDCLPAEDPEKKLKELIHQAGGL